MGKTATLLRRSDMDYSDAAVFERCEGEEGSEEEDTITRCEYVVDRHLCSRPTSQCDVDLVCVHGCSRVTVPRPAHYNSTACFLRSSPF